MVRPDACYWDYEFQMMYCSDDGTNVQMLLLELSFSDARQVPNRVLEAMRPLNQGIGGNNLARDAGCWRGLQGSPAGPIFGDFRDIVQLEDFLHRTLLDGTAIDERI